MPTVVELGKYILYFVAKDKGEPLHFHVSERKHKDATKIWICASGKVVLAHNKSKIPKKRFKHNNQVRRTKCIKNSRPMGNIFWGDIVLQVNLVYYKGGLTVPNKRPELKNIPADKQVIEDCKKIGMTDNEIKRAVIADKVMKAWIAEDGVIWNKLLK